VTSCGLKRWGFGNGGLLLCEVGGEADAAAPGDLVWIVNDRTITMMMIITISSTSGIYIYMCLIVCVS
jgi:hypothetical protein